MALLEEILNRRSIKAFKPKPIEKDKLERVLEAGRLAPSAKNRQEWRFIVIQKEHLREKVKEAAFGDEKVGQAPYPRTVKPVRGSIAHRPSPVAFLDGKDMR